MKLLSNIITLMFLGSMFIGCSEVTFHSVPSQTCENFGDTDGNNCTQGTGKNHYSQTYKYGKVDILFVNDNSGSMHIEQSEMANRFNTFVSSISSLDYHIGMITTDVSASPNNGPKAANGNGAFQDGKLLEFTQNGSSTGEFVLSKSSSNVVAKFADTVQRNETIDCHNASYRAEHCPSNDERGVYALNLAVDRKDSRFFRSDAHLAVIILSDEDERTNGGNKSGYALENYDRPETLVKNIKSKLGGAKSFSVHSIIVRPGDTSCLNNQYYWPAGALGPVQGYEGNSYAALSQPSSGLKGLGGIVDGSLGNICANNYTSQLQNIGANISLPVMKLVCEPMEGSFNVQVTPADPTLNATVNNNEVVFNKTPALGSEVIVNYDCPSSI